MSLLFKHVRIHQVFGANTDVGKTILTTALVRASASKDVPVHYLKPVSTGPPRDADDKHIEFFAGKHSHNLSSACLFRFDEPVSPHLAARLAAANGAREIKVPADDEFITSVSAHIRQYAARTTRPSHMYVETAGGVHSPTLSGTTQADSYRPLFLPTVLVGDAHLGGISSTIAAYEALLLRGYIVDLVLLFSDTYYRNWEYLAPYFAERGVRVLALDPPHQRLADPQEERTAMEKYYATLVPESQDGAMYDALGHLDDCHARRIAELDSMAGRTRDTIWWPFVQHGLVKSDADVNVIDSASQDFFTVYNGNRAPASSPSPLPSLPSHSLLDPQFDGSASWWTQALGHAHSTLTLAAAQAAGRYGHVMFPQATHLPALALAERLVHDGPGKGWAARAFFSDDGSTGMEVALKMALRAFSARHGISLPDRKALGVLGLKGSYHGDTIGAMDACEEGVYTCEWHDAKGVWLDPPTLANRDGRFVVALPSSMSALLGATSDVPLPSLAAAYDVAARLYTPLADVYRAFVRRTLQSLRATHVPLAALVLEPLVMGAGGMVFVDPLFQRILIDIVRAEYDDPPPPTSPPASPSSPQWSGLPVIFDEVFVGFYRLGMRSASSILGVYPDISVHAKILTGGLVPLAATLASDAIFQAFLGANKTDALLHGHSYTAYPVGCAVANASLDIIEKLAVSAPWDRARARWGAPASVSADARQTSVWSFWDPEFIDKLAKLDVVREVMTLGTVLAVKFQDDAGGYQSHSAQHLLEPIRLAVANGDVPSSAPGGAPYGINFRTLGDVAYFMLSLNTPEAVIRSVQDKIWAALAHGVSSTR